MPHNRIYFDFAGAFGLAGAGGAGGVCFGAAGAFFFGFLSLFAGLLFPPLPDCFGMKITSSPVSSSNSDLLLPVAGRLEQAQSSFSPAAFPNRQHR